MSGHGRNVIGTLAALAVAGVALYVGGGWGIVVLEGAAALVVVVLFLRNMNQGDGDVGG
jgi:hypothetical protein